MSELLDPYRDLKLLPFESTWCAPANIAFVKYWGKKGHQLPANPSLSMTLSECVTKTKTHFFPADELSVELKLDGNVEEKFSSKIKTYLQGLQDELPWLQKLSVKIDTTNTFPHGAGIASSASGLAAFALTLADYMKFLRPEGNDTLFFRRASYLARLASGSACRSIYGGFTTWGESSLSGSSDEYASILTVHPDLAQMRDSVLVINSTEKKVSSRAGHGRMHEHFFAVARFQQAKVNFDRCVKAIQSGEFDEIGKILESEALSLHAMMMTSPDVYTLLKPNSLAAMETIWAFRRDTQLPLYFTLDAGPNLHLIYPETFQNKIQTFIEHELAPLGESIIHDKTGLGPYSC